MHVKTVVRSLCLFSSGVVWMVAMAQEPSQSPMVRTWREGTISPPATIKDIRWLVGDWRGSLEGSMQQYVVLKPTKGHMPGFARAWKQDGSIVFYEINDFIEVNGTLEYRVKHFSGDLADWEGKDEYDRHRLIAVTGKAIYFDGITIVKEGRDHFKVYVQIHDGEKIGKLFVIHQSRQRE